MRIAIINEQWTAGATRCARDIQRGLENTHDVHYFPNGKKLNVAEQMDALRILRPDAVHLHSYYSDLPYSFLEDVAAEFPTILTPHDPRPIGNMMLECWNCSEFKTCFNCPLIGRLQRYTLFRHKYYRWRLEKRRIHGRLPKTTAFVCVSDWMRQRILTTELANFRVEMIHNGIDLERFHRMPDARKLLGLPEDKKVLLFVAHHNGWTADERKGGHVFARALAEIVIPKFPDLIVLAAGGGMIPNLPNVKPLGFINQQEISKYYSAADIFVAPSLADNLPYTVLEAMACETPVVASRVGGIPEEVEDNKTGKLFLPGSWQELGAALVELLENPNRARAMGEAGRQRVEKMFGLQAFVKKYEQLYSEIGR
jgi:glycosyltransferase involved in cell wall biosynthesis